MDIDNNSKTIISNPSLPGVSAVGNSKCKIPDFPPLPAHYKKISAKNLDTYAVEKNGSITYYLDGDIFIDGNLENKDIRVTHGSVWVKGSLKNTRLYVEAPDTPNSDTRLGAFVSGDVVDSAISAPSVIIQGNVAHHYRDLKLNICAYDGDIAVIGNINPYISYGNGGVVFFYVKEAGGVRYFGDKNDFLYIERANVHIDSFCKSPEYPGNLPTALHAQGNITIIGDTNLCFLRSKHSVKITGNDCACIMIVPDETTWQPSTTIAPSQSPTALQDPDPLGISQIT